MEQLKIVKEALEKIKATNLKFYDLKEVSPFADYSVVATIDVARQGNACVTYLEDFAKEGKIKITIIKNFSYLFTSWIYS